MSVSGPTFIAAQSSIGQGMLNYGVFQREDGSIFTDLFGNTPIETQIYEAPTAAGTSWSTFASSITGAVMDQSYSPDSNKLAILISDNTTSEPILYEVDATSGSQTNSNVPGDFAAFTAFGSVGVCSCGDGTSLVYGCPANAPASMEFVRRSSGSWDTAVTFADVTDTGGIILGSVSDSTGIAYLIWASLANEPDPQTWTVFLSVVRPDDSFDTPVTVATGFTNDDTLLGFSQTWGPIVTITAANIFVGVANEGVYRSSISSPSFVQSLATPGGFIGVIPAIQPNVMVRAGQVYVTYNVQTYDMGGNVTADGVWVHQYLGSDTWTTAALGVDFLVNPPSGAVLGSTSSDRESTQILSDGTFGTLCRFAGGSVVTGTYYTNWTFPCGISIACGSPPSGTVGTPYTHTFPASGSTAIFYSIASGSLPAGLSLDPATGVVSGTPTAAGSFPFVVQASYAQIMATGDDGSFSDSEIVITSVDGSTWTQQTTAITDSGYSVIYSEATGLWINGTNFAGTTEQIQTSPDGLTGGWTTQSSPADSTGWVKKMVSGKDKIVALYQISSVMHIMTSTDGVTWTARTAPATIASSADVAYSPDLDLYCIAQATFGTPGVLTSPDGITWTFQNVGTNLPAAAITWGAGLFVVVGGPQGSGVHLMTSPDGVTWTIQTNPGGSTQNWAAIHYANGIFVMTSVDTSTNPNNQAATSTDGINWTIRATPGTTKHWACVSYGYGKWISGALNSQNTQPLMVSSDNGVTWSLVSAMSFSFGFITGIAFGPTAGCTASASCSISISAGGTFGNVFGAVSFTQSTANIFI